MIKIISEQEKVELEMHGESDEILAELENVCCLILDKVSKVEGCDPEQLTSYFTHNLYQKSKVNFVYENDADLN